jgi:hypothetical protein
MSANAGGQCENHTTTNGSSGPAYGLNDLVKPNAAIADLETFPLNEGADYA